MAEISHIINQTHFPFKTEYDLRPVLDYWHASSVVNRKSLQDLEEYFNTHKNNFTSNSDGEWDEHTAFLESLFEPFFAFSSLNNAIVAVTCPFLYKNYLLATPASYEKQ